MNPMSTRAQLLAESAFNNPIANELERVETSAGIMGPMTSIWDTILSKAGALCENHISDIFYDFEFINQRIADLDKETESDESYHLLGIRKNGIDRENMIIERAEETNTYRKMYALGILRKPNRYFPDTMVTEVVLKEIPDRLSISGLLRNIEELTQISIKDWGIP